MENTQNCDNLQYLILYRYWFIQSFSWLESTQNKGFLSLWLAASVLGSSDRLLCSEQQRRVVFDLLPLQWAKAEHRRSTKPVAHLNVSTFLTCRCHVLWRASSRHGSVSRHMHSVLFHLVGSSFMQNWKCFLHIMETLTKWLFWWSCLCFSLTFATQ